MASLSDLHGLPKFVDLFDDPRFKAAIAYLREHPRPKGNRSLTDATSIIRSEGAWHGWFEALEELEALKNPPQGKKDNLPKSAPYTTNQPQTAPPQQPNA